MNDPKDASIAELIARSSLGSTATQRVAARTPAATAQRILAAAEKKIRLNSNERRHMSLQELPDKTINVDGRSRSHGDHHVEVDAKHGKKLVE
jgi:hypothetical protein